MNFKTANEIQALNSADLRSYAKEIGVARKANDTKATLAARVITKASELTEATLEEAITVEVTPVVGTPAELIELLQDTAAAADAAAEYAAKVKAAKKAGKCSICFTRTIGTGKGTDPKHAKTMGFCAPCLEEAEWENTHSDEGHEVEGNADVDCWICSPELNMAQKADRAVTTGRSRLGMVIFAKGTYFHKSELVAKAITEAGGTAKIKTAKDGSTTDLTGEVAGVEIVMGWDGNAFAYGVRSTIGGKQVRNVAAALRAIAALKK